MRSNLQGFGFLAVFATLFESVRFPAFVLKKRKRRFGGHAGSWANKAKVSHLGITRFTDRTNMLNDFFAEIEPQFSKSHNSQTMKARVFGSRSSRFTPSPRNARTLTLTYIHRHTHMCRSPSQVGSICILSDIQTENMAATKLKY